jgi:hypothetical protein
MQSPTYDLDNCVLKKSIHRFVSVLEVELTYSLFYSTHAISIGALLLDKGARAIGVLLPPGTLLGKKPGALLHYMDARAIGAIIVHKGVMHFIPTEFSQGVLRRMPLARAPMCSRMVPGLLAPFWPPPGRRGFIPSRVPLNWSCHRKAPIALAPCSETRAPMRLTPLSHYVPRPLLLLFTNLHSNSPSSTSLLTQAKIHSILSFSSPNWAHVFVFASQRISMPSYRLHFF